MSIGVHVVKHDFADYLENLSVNSAKEEATVKGLKIVYPAQDEIQIDIDSEKDYERYDEMFDLLETFFGPVSSKDMPSRNGGDGRHITIKVNRPLANIERIALQAVMGSDSRREFFSLVRYMLMQEQTPTLFFEKP